MINQSSSTITLKQRKVEIRKMKCKSASLFSASAVASKSVIKSNDMFELSIVGVKMRFILE